MAVTVIKANLSLAKHAADVVRLLDVYASDPVANGAPLPDGVKRDLIAGLRTHPTTIVFLAYRDEIAVGLAICFVGFSTFAAKRLLNVHDFVVVSEARRAGVGKALLAAIEAHAREIDCCKLTLEVMDNNAPAKQLYAAVGFAPYALDSNQSTTLLLQKKLAS